MKVPVYYYLLQSGTGKWLIHRRGCEMLTGSPGKIFLGTVYSTRQAVGVARNRVREPKLCYLCFRDEI